MEIARIDVHQVDLPYAGGTYRLSGGRTYTGFDATIVRIETDGGCEGWGDAVECLAWTRGMGQWTDPPAPGSDRLPRPAHADSRRPLRV